MSDTTFYVLVVWASGFTAGVSAACALTFVALKYGWVRIKE